MVGMHVRCWLRLKHVLRPLRTTTRAIAMQRLPAEVWKLDSQAHHEVPEHAFKKHKPSRTQF